METFEVLKQVQDKHEHRMADYLNASTNEMVLDAMQEYTKPLIDEIAELRKEVEYQKSGYITLKEYLKTDDILGAIAKLKSELKASKSEANEAVEFAEWVNKKSFIRIFLKFLSRVLIGYQYQSLISYQVSYQLSLVFLFCVDYKHHRI